MAALTLANMLTRVKRNVPTTTMDTELQDALLERMNYLATLDALPFQEGHADVTLAANQYTADTPTDFAYPRSLVIFQTDKYRPLEFMSVGAFDDLYPRPDQSTDEITHYTVKVAEGKFWFNSTNASSLAMKLLFHKIPDDATDVTISQLSELAKITLIKWASADGFRHMGEHDRAGQFEAEGDKMFMAMKKRYQLALEQDSRFISYKEQYLRRVTN